MNNCVETALFGTVCDYCDGGAIFQIINTVIKIMTTGIGILAVLGIIISGITYLTAGGNTAKVQKAKNRVLEIVIGLAIYVALFAILEFLIPGNIFASPGESACPDKPVAGSPTTSPGYSGQPVSIPMATVQGEESPGTIECPKNANYEYSAQPSYIQSASRLQDAISRGVTKDKYYQSKATSCPFTAVVYSQEAEDLKCSPDGKMHYDEEHDFCIINSKVDVFEYLKYLHDNWISQDGWTCLTNGDCKQGISFSRNGNYYDELFKTGNLSDWGQCQAFARIFTRDLNNGTLVSNDAYASREDGLAWADQEWGLLQYGNADRKLTQSLLGSIGQTARVYNDGYGTFDTRFEGDPSNLKEVLNGLKQGYAISVGWEVGTTNQHYMTAIGFTKTCRDASYTCSTAQVVVIDPVYSKITPWDRGSHILIDLGTGKRKTSY